MGFVLRILSTRTCWLSAGSASAHGQKCEIVRSFVYEALLYLFPTLAVGLSDFKVDVVLARLEADFSDQPPSIPAVPNHQVSLQCPATKYPCSSQPPSIPAVPNRKVSLHCPTTKYPCSAELQSMPEVYIPAAPNRRVSLQCPTTKYPCSAQPPRIPAVPNRRVSLQCPTTKYPCSAQPPSIPAVPNRQVSLQCSTTKYILAMPNRKVPLQCPTTKYPCRALRFPSSEYPWSAQQQRINFLAAHLQCCKEDS